MKKYRIQKMLLAVILAVVFCFACSSSDDSHNAGGQIAQDRIEVTAGTGVTAGGGETGSSELMVPGGSTFTIAVDSFGGPPNIVGQVCDAPKLAYRMVVWDLIQEKDGCKLFEPRTPFCDPACERPTECVEDSVCGAEQTCFDAGTVSLKGLQNTEGKETLSLMYVGKRYTFNTSTVRSPPFTEGDSVTLEASGAEVEAFIIESRGVAPLEVLSTDGILMDRGKPVAVSWTAATIADNSRIEIRVDISHHGGQRGEVVCEVADTGTFEIPADVVTALIDLGVAGFPSLTVERFALGSTTITTGRVNLRVSSIEERMIEIPGVVSCTNDLDCPEGQTCQDNFMCQ